MKTGIFNVAIRENISKKFIEDPLLKERMVSSPLTGDLQ